MTEAIHDDPLAALIDRSESFEGAILGCFPESGASLAIMNTQSELVASACNLCIEHARTLRAAFAAGSPNSGSALLRLQYEALLRAAWLMFAATPPQIDRLAKTLDLEAEQAAKNLPGYLEMLNAVVKVAPAGLAAPLAEFNQYSRHALNSFVHSGIHALHRSHHGYPIELALTVVRFSNAILHIAYRLFATLTGSQWCMDRVTRIYADFPDCIPMSKN
ncbi:MAG: hypothetical protein K8F53_13215 [Rhodocyclaceae bacterium]|nr:hypothetical protein [Rhodocyclaceae bacterium]